MKIANGDGTEDLTKDWWHLPYLIGLWVTAIVVLTHAVLPVGSPLSRDYGSAFSASTADVTLGTSQRPEMRALFGRSGLSGGEGGTSGDSASTGAILPDFVYVAPNPISDAHSSRSPLTSRRAIVLGASVWPRAPPVG